MDDVGTLYKIRPKDQSGPDKNVHRSELRPIPLGMNTPASLSQDPAPAVEDSNGPRVPVVQDDDLSLDEEQLVDWVLQTQETQPQTAAQLPASSEQASPLVLLEREVRRSSRATAGRHPNPFNQPRSTVQRLVDTEVSQPP